MEGITGYLLPGCLFVLIILGFSALKFNHLFIWMDPEVVAHDEIIRNKTGYLNLPFFFMRAIVYITGWVLYREITRKLSLKQDVDIDFKSFSQDRQTLIQEAYQIAKQIENICLSDMVN